MINIKQALISLLKKTDVFYALFGIVVFGFAIFPKTVLLSFQIRHLVYRFLDVNSIPQDGYSWSEAWDLGGSTFTAFLSHEVLFYVWLACCISMLFRAQMFVIKKIF